MTCLVMLNSIGLEIMMIGIWNVCPWSSPLECTEKGFFLNFFTCTEKSNSVIWGFIFSYCLTYFKVSFISSIKIHLWFYEKFAMALMQAREAPFMPLPFAFCIILFCHVRHLSSITYCIHVVLLFWCYIQGFIRLELIRIN